MRKSWGLILSAVFISTAASAADIPVKAPPSAPVYGWTGWYAGVNAGAGFGNVKTDFDAPVAITLVTPPPFPTNHFDFAGTNREIPGGFIGGGQIGYNWQRSPTWVVGIEGDMQGALEKDSNTLTRDTLPVPAILAYQTKIEWFGTVRGRVGYVWGNGAVMSYVTGGLAYGEVDAGGTVSVGLGSPSVTRVFDHSRVNAGWTVGYGTEGKLLIPGWTYKVEALYIDLGTLDATAPSASIPHLLGVSAATAGPLTMHSHFTDSILRVGLDYQFH